MAPVKTFLGSDLESLSASLAIDTVARGYDKDLPVTSGYAGFSAISAITGAYAAYEAGQMRKLAYEHEAAMSEINAKQIEIESQFAIAGRTEALAETLALQNVMAAASGRAGGTLAQLAQTSIANLQKEKKRIKVTGEARKVATLMDVESTRAAGKTAARFGLLGATTELARGAAETSRFIS
jgi:hypothetical protein